MLSSVIEPRAMGLEGPHFAVTNVFFPGTVLVGAGILNSGPEPDTLHAQDWERQGEVSEKRDEL